MIIPAELNQIAADLRACASDLSAKTIADPAKRLEKVTNDFAGAWSGSFFGYHANIYYQDFKAPPPGDHFDIETGHKDVYGQRIRPGTWTEYAIGDLEREIRRRANIDGPESFVQADKKARSRYEALQGRALSLLYRAQEKSPDDKFLEAWIQKTTESIPTQESIAKSLGPRRRMQTADTIASQGGIVVPVHLELQSYAVVLRVLHDGCEALARTLDVISGHLAEGEGQSLLTDMDAGKKIFIGHGQSPVWRDLKDFLSERLHLEYDEFNRVPIAGVATAERLKQMLDDASFAFLVLTAEDQVDEDTVRARQNVIHEAGLFQGKLGFNRAIILLEEGCEEFSNIAGLGQIRFPKGNISAKFEEIRRVLEREKLIATGLDQGSAKPAKPTLSSAALELLNEIDAQPEDKGEGRGITLISSPNIGVGQGFYRPYLWSAMLQEGQLHIQVSSLGPVRRAVAELVKADFLGEDADDAHISRFYRTETPRP